jgi:hypothetical protein
MGSSVFDGDIGVNGNVLFKNKANSTTAFRVQNSTATATLINVDTTGTGAISFGGVAPAAVGTAGTAGGTILTVTAPAGGESFGTGFTAGIGSGITLQTGVGGAATAFTGANVAGAGGLLALTGGNGGVAVSSGTGGAGGDIAITAGNGGNGATTGGRGGNITLSAGSVGTGGTPTAGSVIVKNASNSVSAFQIQNASSNTLFSVDTQNSRVVIGPVTLGQTASAKIFIGDTGNVNNLWIAEANGTDSDILQLQGKNGIILSTGTAADQSVVLSSTGQATFKNTTDSSAAFQIQTAAGVNAVNLNTTYDTTNLFSANPSFEVNTTGWAGEAAGGSIARTTTAGQFYYGDAGGAVTTTTTAGTGVRYNLTLTDATTYNITIPIKGATGFATLEIGYASTGLVGSEGTVGQSCTALTVTTSWGYVSCTFTTTTTTSTTTTTTTNP